jgi:competence protein ComEC
MITKQGICAAALCWAVLVYTGLAPLPPQGRTVSLLPLAATERVIGRVISNPVKTSSGAYYRFTVQLSGVSGRLGSGTRQLESEAKGRVAVLFPSELMEANFPGKLYSAAQNRARKNGSIVPAVPLETGALLTLRGRVLPPLEDAAFSRLRPQTTAFLADAAEYAAYDRTFQGRFAEFRGQCRLAFRRLMYAWGDAGGLFLALMSGATEYIDGDMADKFRAAGLAHILAISGMHLSIFSGLMRFTAKKSGRRVSEIFSAAAVLAFVWFAGFSPSLRRALIFFLLSFCAKRIGKSPGMAELLAVTFCIHFFIAPEELLTLSFILSYTGLAGILVLSGLANRLLARIPYCYPAGGIAASAGALFTTAPVSAVFWGYIAPASILASPVVSPLAGAFMAVGIVCTTLSLAVPALLFPLGNAMDTLYRCIHFLAGIFAQIPQIILR